MNPPKDNNFVLTKDTRRILRRSVTEFPITQSEIMCRASCPRKWFYRYGLGLKKRGSFNWHFLYGNLLHELLAKLYASGYQGSTSKEFPITTPEIKFPEDALPTQEDMEKADMLRKIARVTFQNYRRHYSTLDTHMVVKGVE